MDSENLLAGNVDYLKDALAVLEELERAKANREQLQGSLKDLERDIAGEEKASADETELTLRKRREEIAASFDREIRKDQERERKVRADREKAKDKGVAGRIEAETAELREENRRIREEIRGILKENRLPRFCNTKLYFGLFMPRGILEYGMFALSFFGLLFLLPLGVFQLIPMKLPLTMLTVSFLCTFFFFLCYQFVVRRTKLKNWQAICQVRAQRDRIQANHRKMRAIRNAILKDKNEQGYDLEKFDTAIRELESEVKRGMQEKQEALTAFEETTKAMLVEEITGRYQEKLSELQVKRGETDRSLKEADGLVKDINRHITANYEAFLGKDYVTEHALQDMIMLMEQGSAATVAEALALYKAER